MSYEIQKSPEQNKPLTLEALQALTAERERVAEGALGGVTKAVANGPLDPNNGPQNVGLLSIQEARNKLVSGLRLKPNPGFKQHPEGMPPNVEHIIQTNILATFRTEHQKMFSGKRDPDIAISGNSQTGYILTLDGKDLPELLKVGPNTPPQVLENEIARFLRSYYVPNGDKRSEGLSNTEQLSQELGKLSDSINNLSRFDPAIAHSANKFFQEGINIANNIRKEYGGKIPADLSDRLNTLLTTLTSRYDAAAKQEIQKYPSVTLETASSLYSRARRFSGPRGVLSGNNEAPFPDIQDISKIA